MFQDFKFCVRLSRFVFLSCVFFCLGVGGGTDCFCGFCLVLFYELDRMIKMYAHGGTYKFRYCCYSATCSHNHTKSSNEKDHLFHIYLVRYTHKTKRKKPYTTSFKAKTQNLSFPVTLFLPYMFIFVTELGAQAQNANLQIMQVRKELWLHSGKQLRGTIQFPYLLWSENWIKHTLHLRPLTAFPPGRADVEVCILETSIWLKNALTTWLLELDL